MEKITVPQILAERAQVEKTNKLEHEAYDRKDSEIKSLTYDVYYNRIRDLERERDEALRTLAATHDAAIAKLKEKTIQHNKLVLQAQHILEILRVEKDKDLRIADGDIELNERRYGYEPYKKDLGYLVNDALLKIKLFVLANPKPVNKYTLAVFGRSVFGEPLIKFPHGWLDGVNTFSLHFAIETGLIDRATVLEIVAYVNKHKAELLKDTLEQYRELKAEYKVVTQTYTLEDFKDLLVWRCPQCNNFLSILDSWWDKDAPKCRRHEPDVAMVATGVKGEPHA